MYVSMCVHICVNVVVCLCVVCEYVMCECARVLNRSDPVKSHVFAPSSQLFNQSVFRKKRASLHFSSVCSFMSVSAQFCRELFFLLKPQLNHIGNRLFYFQTIKGRIKENNKTWR